IPESVFAGSQRRNSILRGFAVHRKNLTAEISGEFEFFGEKNVEPNIIDDEIVNMPGKYDNSVADIILSLTYRF
ncbi:MAG: hypothetical protein ACP5G4_09355, partial [bacterium]